MSNAIDVNLLNKELMKYLEGYKEDIEDVVMETADKIGKEAVQELKQTSPQGARKEYCKGWRLKKGKVDKNKYTIKIHNKTDYQLTHLLENGHATADGGHTKPQPHIKPVEEKYGKKFETELKRKLEGLK